MGLWDSLVAMPGERLGRLISLPLMLGTGAVLLTAMSLTPAVEGHGTHLQLGLGTCSFLQLTGQPCPMCGATTTFTMMAHLQLPAALLNQPFAAALFLLTVGVFAVSVSEILLPRLRWQRILKWLAPREGKLAAGFLVFMAVAWAYKAWLMAIPGGS